jgi:hypothetical protein
VALSLLLVTSLVEFLESSYNFLHFKTKGEVAIESAYEFMTAHEFLKPKSKRVIQICNLARENNGR